MAKTESGHDGFRSPRDRGGGLVEDGCLGAAWRSVAVSVVLLVSVLASPARAGDAESGRTKAAACVQCHGPNGIAVNPGAPNLAGQPQEYLAAQLKHFRSGQRVDPVMNVIAKPLADEEIDDLAAWYASIAIDVKMP